MFGAGNKVLVCGGVCLATLLLVGVNSLIEAWIGVPLLLLTATGLWRAIRGGARG